MKPEEGSQLTLYSYWRSSAAYRVRIALHLKGLDFTTIPVHLVRNGGEQHAETYRLVNPQGLVPVLEHEGRVLTQSMAICEYLDECFEPHPLLPADPLGRAWIRSLVLQIACEIHPLNNLRVQKFLKGQCGDGVDSVAWMQHWFILVTVPVCLNVSWYPRFTTHRGMTWICRCFRRSVKLSHAAGRCRPLSRRHRKINRMLNRFEGRMSD